MRQFTKLLSALIVLVLATAFIGCGNPSSSSDGTSGGSGSGDGNSNSPTYTTVAGGTYICSDDNDGFVFNDDYSVNRISSGHSVKRDGWKWRIVDGYTVQIYEESTDGLIGVIYTFTANSGFTQLTIHGAPLVYNRQ